MIITRKYVKIVDTLGEMGGIFELVFIFVGMFYFCYRDYARSNYIKKFIHKRPIHEYKEILGEDLSK